MAENTQSFAQFMNEHNKKIIEVFTKFQKGEITETDLQDPFVQRLVDSFKQGPIDMGYSFSSDSEEE